MTGTDLQPAASLFNPITGQTVTLDASSAELAQFLLDVREVVEPGLREMKAAVSQELLGRLDRKAKWTDRAGGFKITSTSPRAQENWDGARLREALLQLVDDGVLSIEAVDAAVEVTVAYSVKRAGINQLRKLGGRVAEVVDRLCSKSDPDRRVSVSRERSPR